MDPNRPARTYSREEMDEILRRALARPQQDGVTHDELVAAAREVGIDPAAIDAAAAEVTQGRQSRNEIDSRTRALRARFYRSLVAYLLVNAFLFSVNMLTGGRRWFYWVLLGWGLGIAMQGVRAFFPGEETPEALAERRLAEARRAEKLARRAEKYERIEARRREKEARRQRHEDIRRGAAHFEQAVEQGVAALLTAVARQVEKQVDAAGIGRSSPAEPDPRSRVRVDANDEPVRPANPTEREAESVARGESRRASRSE